MKHLYTSQAKPVLLYITAVINYSNKGTVQHMMGMICQHTERRSAVSAPSDFLNVTYAT